MSRVTLAIYDRDEQLVADLGEAGDTDDDATWWPGADLLLDELDDRGALTFNVQIDEPAIADIETRHVVVVSRDGDPVWRGWILRRVWHEIAADEAGRFAEYTCVGEVMGRLDELRVHPPGGLGLFPFPDERPFNWLASEYDDSGWDAAVVTPANYGQPDIENYGLPEGFPWGEDHCEWIWDQDSSGTVPGGVKRFRATLVSSSTQVVEAWSAADDRNEVWIGGKSVLRSSDAPYDGRTTAVEMLLSDGSFQVAAEAENRNDLKAGLLFGIGKPLEDEDPPLLGTGADWLVAPDEVPLGMNAGQILHQLRTEGVARGEDWPAFTFTVDKDSKGDDWTIYEEIIVQLGEAPASPADVLRQMVELEMCEFRASPDGFELNVFNPGGAGTDVNYELTDEELTKLDWVTEKVIATVLLVRWARGYVEVEHPDAGVLAEHGRVVAPLSLGGMQSEAAAVSVAEKVLARYAVPRTQIVAEFDPAAEEDEPWTKWSPGDWITLPGPGGASDQRVLEATMLLDESGQPMYGGAFGDRVEEMAKRERVILQRLAGSLGGRSHGSTIPYEPRALSPRDPLEEVWSSGPNPIVVVGDRRSFSRTVRLREFRMILTGTITGTYSARLRKNGTPIPDSELDMTFEGERYALLTDVVRQRPAGSIEAEITAVGSGATSVTLVAVYA